MFEQWEVDGYPTLLHVDRAVTVDVTQVFPPSSTRKDELALGLRAAGLWLEPHMAARQVAWLRRTAIGSPAYRCRPAAPTSGLVY